MNKKFKQLLIGLTALMAVGSAHSECTLDPLQYAANNCEITFIGGNLDTKTLYYKVNLPEDTCRYKNRMTLQYEIVNSDTDTPQEIEEKLVHNEVIGTHFSVAMKADSENRLVELLTWTKDDVTGICYAENLRLKKQSQ